MALIIKTSQRDFITDPKRWRGKSVYFDNLFSGKWGDKQDGGSYFIETDADVFEHILRYLRTGVLPVFYHKEKGHHFPLYHAVLGEAIYFAIDRLEKWLRQRKYLDAVKTHYLANESKDASIRTLYGSDITYAPDGSKFMSEHYFVDVPATSNMKISITPITVQKSVFYCPKGLHTKADMTSCLGCVAGGKEVVGIGGGWRSEASLHYCIVREEIIFDHDLCVTAFLEDDGV